ncbi:MAG: hypothetical protein CBB97_00895 [Candidatus Endolissoclinum sp. TMED37]|nr:MAG: hypothetical protein CBB97_00895 [Candidatus Endolissoclinum sp. TMED37]
MNIRIYINDKFSLVQILTYLLCISPFLYISGPLFTDILVCLCGLIFLIEIIRKKRIREYLSVYTAIYLLWCAYLIIRSLFAENIFVSLQSSLFYFRFGFFLLSITYVIKENKNFLKYFFYFLLSSYVLLSFDALIQYLSGSNILNFHYNSSRLAGLFGDEYILGSYFSRLFPILLMLYFCYFKNIRVEFLILISIPIFFIILISGERTALFYFVITFILMFLTIKQLRFSVIILFLIGILISVSTILFDNNIKKRLIDKTLIDTNIIKGNINIFSPKHEALYLSSLKMISSNYLFGVGPKMFRIKCDDEEYFVRTNQYSDSCSTHPHNIYLQLFAETGLFGFLPFLIFSIYIFYILFKIIIFSFNNKNYSNQFCLSLIAVIIFLWPLIPTGSFFSNYINYINYLSLGFLLHFYNNEYMKN